MSWTVVADSGVYQVRASISNSKEMQELIDNLLEKQAKLLETETKEKKDE